VTAPTANQDPADLLSTGRVRRDLRQERQERQERQDRRPAAVRILPEIRLPVLQAVSASDSQLSRRAHTHTAEDRLAAEPEWWQLALLAKGARPLRGRALRHQVHRVQVLRQNLLEDLRHRQRPRTVCYRS